MGVEYWLLDKKNKIFYDLGKGGWYEFNYDLEAFQDLEYLTDFILNDVFQLEYCNTEESKNDLINYIKNELAPELYNLFHNSKPEELEVVNDCGDDMVICKAKRYKCIGTIYYFDDPKKKQEDIDYNNRHLEDTELNKRWYNPENYKQYLEWVKY